MQENFPEIKLQQRRWKKKSAKCHVAVHRFAGKTFTFQKDHWLGDLHEGGRNLCAAIFNVVGPVWNEEIWTGVPHQCWSLMLLRRKSHQLMETPLIKKIDQEENTMPHGGGVYGGGGCFFITEVSTENKLVIGSAFKKKPLKVNKFDQLSLEKNTFGGLRA